MRIIHCFSHVKKGFQTSAKLAIKVLILALFSQPISAHQVKLEVSGGGKIINADNNFICSENCNIQTFSKTILSLLAAPEEGYRFAGWDADCGSNLGTLCTLKLNEDGKVIAKFVKSGVAALLPQAVLLLHDAEEKHTVWNDYVRQRFNDECPVIYGGVLLDEEIFDSKKDVGCYRIAFGYYSLLRDSLVASTAPIDRPVRKTKPFFSPTYFGHEIHAAVLSILNRHPNVNLTLVSHGKTTLAAQSFLQSVSDGHKDITGLLALHPTGPAVEMETNALASGLEGIALLTIDANPDQIRKINAALTQLSDAEWPLR